MEVGKIEEIEKEWCPVSRRLIQNKSIRKHVMTPGETAQENFLFSSLFLFSSESSGFLLLSTFVDSFYSIIFPLNSL